MLNAMPDSYICEAHSPTAANYAIHLSHLQDSVTDPSHLAIGCAVLPRALNVLPKER